MINPIATGWISLQPDGLKLIIFVPILDGVVEEEHPYLYSDI